MINKLYLIVYGGNITRERIIEILNSNQYVNNWFYNMPNSIFVVSSYNAKELFDQLGGTPTSVMVVTEVTGNYWGSLEMDYWKNFPPVKFFGKYS